jgi:hypothetical protein
MSAAAGLKPPATYAEWVDLLDMLKEKKDDTEVLNALKKGTIAWQSGVAERFTQKLITTVNMRIDNAIDKFQKEMKRGSGQEAVIVQAILALRREMSFLYNVIDLPVIPEKDRAQYCALVRGQADKMQSSLEDSARKDRSGKMSSIVRNHKINVF